MGTVRTFVAVPLAPSIIQATSRIVADLGQLLPEVRWIRPENLHLTIRFFGDLAEENLEKIAEIMLSIGRLTAPFPLAIARLGAFPSPARPRVFWLGVAEDQPLRRLQGALEEGFRSIGLPGEDRPFSPHLTIGRARGRLAAAGKILEDYRDLRLDAMTVETVTLFESRLRPQGALHLPRRTIPLTGDC